MRSSLVPAACAIAAISSAASGCAPPSPARRAEVEALFDVPREYRILSTLPCAEGAALVYLASAPEADLYSFEPDQLQFRRIGKLSCPARPNTWPNSMAVDRSGVAWLNFTDGSLYQAKTSDASCAATDFAIGQHGFGNFGMAFVSTGADLTDESLFVWGGHEWARGGWDSSANAAGLGLGRIDRSLAVTPLGHDDGRLSPMRADLTGTGDGHLFGFFAATPAVIAEIDVHTGATSNAQPLPGVGNFSAWAFSAWGGSFWLYWAPFGSTSRVTRVDPDGTLTEVMRDVGFRIVGAGVSTCAPIGR